MTDTIEQMRKRLNAVIADAAEQLQLEKTGQERILVSALESISQDSAVRGALAEPDHIPDAKKMVESADGEVAELIMWLRWHGTGGSGRIDGTPWTASQLTRAADLLERLAPQPVPEGPSDAELLRCANIGTPCHDTKAWDRELQMMRAAIAADRAHWGRQ